MNDNSPRQELITFELVQGVAKITLRRPEVLNSFNAAMAQELLLALAKVGKDKAIRSVLLTGEGRAFCAGQDLAEVTPAENEKIDLKSIVEKHYNPIIKAIRHTEKPFVCAVNGIAAGAGANLALACDIVLASKEATFIQSFCKVGLIPDSGGTFFLPRLVGLGRAAGLMMLGDKVTADQALEFGMIYKVTDANSLQEMSFAIARHLAKQPTLGIGLTKRALNKSLGSDLDSQLAMEADLQGTAGNSEDYTEGVTAFIEKRKPNFTGK